MPMHHGNPAQWEHEVHRALHADERAIMSLAKQGGSDGFTSHDIVKRGYKKSHMSCWRRLMKLEQQGLIERSVGGGVTFFHVTEYGRWMTRIE